MFVDQQRVDEYVEHYLPKAKVADACNNFLAGHLLRSKSRYSALDETAVMGAVCRHEYPVPCFLSLRHGERIAYAVYICERLCQLFPDHNIQLMYDVACNLEKHLKANKRSDVLDKFEFAIPVFHAYGHESACQIRYNPRNVVGFGLSDGEGVERLRSYLRRFAAMTKEMHPSHRVNILSDALSYYGQKSARNLSGQSIAIRLSRRINVVSKAQLEKFNSERPLSESHGKMLHNSIPIIHTFPAPFDTKQSDCSIVHVELVKKSSEKCSVALINTAKQGIEENELDAYCCGVLSLLAAKKKQCILDLTRLRPFIDFHEISQFLDSICGDSTISTDQSNTSQESDSYIIEDTRKHETGNDDETVNDLSDEEQYEDQLAGDLSDEEQYEDQLAGDLSDEEQ